jgi:transcriptional regulator with XRE-family HTH domain
MSIAELRKELGLSLEAFAAQLGLTSKGYVSDLERGKATCTAALALRIEALSGGRIQARTLNADVALVEEARGIAPAQDAA